MKSKLPDTPLKPEAKLLFDKISPKIEKALDRITRIPVSVLVWGPSPNSTSKEGKLRLTLRTELRQKGHAAFFSEELSKKNSTRSIRLQQIVQAKEFDLVVSLPTTPGAIAEVHDFANDKRVNSKMLVFLNKSYIHGYSSQSLNAISTSLSARVIYYLPINMVKIVKTVVYEEVEKIREAKFIFNGGI